MFWRWAPSFYVIYHYNYSTFVDNLPFSLLPGSFTIAYLNKICFYIACLKEWRVVFLVFFVYLFVFINYAAFLSYLSKIFPVLRGVQLPHICIHTWVIFPFFPILFFFVVLGIETRVLHMLANWSTIELHLQPSISIFLSHCAASD
jgi:hypothetical protein